MEFRESGTCAPQDSPFDFAQVRLRTAVPTFLDVGALSSGDAMNHSPVVMNH
jgi:hypothetical protein